MDPATFPRHNYHHRMHTLRQNLLPPPPDPAAAIARDYAAIVQVAALCPANAAEAAIAAQAVAANAQAMVTMGLANDQAAEPRQVLQCTAQAASMMRQAQGALRILQAMQAERRKREVDHEAADRSAWIEYGAAQWMTEALPAAHLVPPHEAPGQNREHCPTSQMRETKSSLPAPYQNREHDPTPRVHETDSVPPAHTGPYQNPGHDPIHYSYETETTITPPPRAAPAPIDAEPASSHPPDKPVPEEPPCPARSKASASSTSPMSSPAPSPPTSWDSWAPMSSRSKTPPTPTRAAIPAATMT